MIIWVIVVLRLLVMTLQWRFDYLSGSDHQSLLVTSAQVVETSVSVITNSPSSSHLEYRAAGHM